MLGDKLFMVTDNAHLIALNRTTGALVWEVVMPDEAQRYGSTVAPLIVKDMVVAGVSGGDWGIRGFLAAYKADTGERAWRFWTVPAKGEPGYETWKGKVPSSAEDPPGSPAATTPKPTPSSGRPLRLFPTPTIATGPATIFSPNASWRSIPTPES